jgi:maltose alpha-D-glucosyltransferase/alpha-amylase
MGVTPVECMGGVVFPRIGELSYLLTLPGHGFYWFQLPAAMGEDGGTAPAITAHGVGGDGRAADGRGADGEQRSGMGEHLPGPPESHQQ